MSWLHSKWNGDWYWLIIIIWNYCIMFIYYWNFKNEHPISKTSLQKYGNLSKVHTFKCDICALCRRNFFEGGSGINFCPTRVSKSKYNMVVSGMFLGMTINHFHFQIDAWVKKRIRYRWHPSCLKSNSKYLWYEDLEWY